VVLWGLCYQPISLSWSPGAGLLQWREIGRESFACLELYVLLRVVKLAEGHWCQLRQEDLLGSRRLLLF
jgi:hypothetical protein